MRFILLLIALLAFASPALAEQEIPVPGKVTLLDLESDCIPCDLQDRIVHRIEKDFAKSVAFVYVDVEKNPQYKEKYRIEILPTLIFFDREGREVERKSGYLKEGAMRKILTELTAKQDG